MGIKVNFDLKAYLLEKRRIVDGALDEYFPKVDGLTADLIEAMRYSLFAGGKRLRPILCMAGAEMVGGRTTACFPWPALWN
jgi:geranylgeranyl diphosphate synthase type II